MKFTEEQRNKISLHIDSIYVYLLNLQDGIHEPIDINLENPSATQMYHGEAVDSSISSFSLTNNSISLTHNSNSVRSTVHFPKENDWLTPITVGSTPIFGNRAKGTAFAEQTNSIYDNPQVGYDLLLNWQTIKEKLLAELNEQKEEYSRADEVINAFVV